MMFFFSSRRRHTRYIGDWSSDVCSSDLLRRQFSGLEDGRGSALGVKPHDLGVGAACRIEVALGIRAQRPQIGGIGISKRGEPRRQDQLAITPQRHTLGRAFFKLLIGGLPPVARVLGARHWRQSAYEEFEKG